MENFEALVINDTHACVVRSGGTTPVTASLLRQRILNNMETLIMQHTDKHIIHAGDLLDRFDVARADLLQVLVVLHRWLNASDKNLYLIRGNHDANPRADKVSSWTFLCSVLSAQYGDRIKVINGQLTQIHGNIYGLGHCDNQDLLELELEGVMELENPVLITHVNFDNKFADASDHSLHISRDWAKKFVAKGGRLYSGHEHNKSTHLGGKVVMFGTQDVTSVSDCLDCDAKYAHVIDASGELTPIMTLTVSDEFSQVDWQELGDAPDKPFIRVTGTVTADQAAHMINAISRFRQRSSALVVTNAVKITGAQGDFEVDAVSLEQIKAFDVLAALLDKLDPKQQATVKRLLEN